MASLKQAIGHGKAQALRALLLGVAIISLAFFYIIRDKADAFGPIDTATTGFAWSENFGWISFNSKDCDVDDDGTYEGAAESAPAGCPTSGAVAQYGVQVDSVTKEFSGYAWGEHIGWLYFGSDIADDTSPGVGYLASSSMPNAPLQWPKVGGSGQVDGWFSALSLRADYWDRLADLPVYSYYGGSLAYTNDGYLYALVGDNRTNFYRYSTTTNVWQGVTAAPAAVGRGADLVYPGSGDCIYALRGNTTNTFWCYSRSGNNWNALANLPATVNYGGSLEYVNYNNKSYIYALRGLDTRDFYRYDIAANTWQAMASTTVSIGGQGHLLAYPGYGKYLYSLAGYRAGGSYDFLKYDLGTNAWSSVGANTPQTQNGASNLVALKNSGYLYASLGENNNTWFYRFNIASGAWEVRNDLCYNQHNAFCKFPAENGFDAVQGDDGYLYAMQGNYQLKAFRYKTGDDHGWLKMSRQGGAGASHKVSLDEGSGVFSGWAWGGEASASSGLGWLNFNYQDCDGDDNGVADGGACGSGPISKYFVKLGAGGPSISDIVAPGRTAADACSSGARHARVSWTYNNSYKYCYANAGATVSNPNKKVCQNDAECTGGTYTLCLPGKQKYYEVVLKKSAGAPTGDVMDELSSGNQEGVINPGQGFTYSDSAFDSNLAWGQKYYVWVKVWDTANRTPGWKLMSQTAGDGGWVVEDGDPATFTMPNHEVPLVAFTWAPDKPSKNELITFQPVSGTSTTAVYRTAAPTTAIDPTTDDSWLWTFNNGDPATSSAVSPKARFTQTGNTTITLKLTDKLAEGGYSCSTSTTLNANLRLPNWKENNPK